MSMPLRALYVLLTAALAVSATAAQTPEATSPTVARCAAAASLKLEAHGVDGRAVATVVADRANASIDRWETAFSAANSQHVATLIRVPLTVTYRDGALPFRSLLEARCGLTNDRLLALETVPVAMPAQR